MNFNKLIKRRYSVRAYKSDPVSDSKLQKVLKAGCLAPTAANRQPFQFIVIHTQNRQSELKRIYPREWFSQAPIVICVCAIPSQAWTRGDSKNYSDIDATIAMDHLILAAANLGLGTCWVAAFDPVAVREILKLPDKVEPIAFTPLGYPADKPREKKRKSLDELVRYEKY